MPRPPIRCFYFNEQGDYVDPNRPCRRGDQCLFVHPNDKDWDIAIESTTLRTNRRRPRSSRYYDRDSPTARGSSPPLPGSSSSGRQPYIASGARGRSTSRERSWTRRDTATPRDAPKEPRAQRAERERERLSSPPSHLDKLMMTSHLKSKSKDKAKLPSQRSLDSVSAGPSPPTAPPPHQPPAPGAFKPIGPASSGVASPASNVASTATPAAGLAPPANAPLTSAASTDLAPALVLVSEPPNSAVPQTLSWLRTEPLELKRPPTRPKPRSLASMSDAERKTLRETWSQHITYILRILSLRLEMSRRKTDLTDLIALQSAPYFKHVSEDERRRVQDTINEHKKRLGELKAECEKLIGKVDENIWPERKDDVSVYVERIEQVAEKVMAGFERVKKRLERREREDSDASDASDMEEGEVDVDMDVDDDEGASSSRRKKIRRGKKKKELAMDSDSFEQLTQKLEDLELTLNSNRDDISSLRDETMEEVQDIIANTVNTGVDADDLIDVKKELETVTTESGAMIGEVGDLWQKWGEQDRGVKELGTAIDALQGDITNIGNEILQARQARETLTAEINALSAALNSYHAPPAPQLDFSDRAINAVIEDPIRQKIREAIVPLVDGYRDEVQKMLHAQAGEVLDVITPKLNSMEAFVAKVYQKVDAYRADPARANVPRNV